MAVVKIVNEKYYGENSIENLINYVTDMQANLFESNSTPLSFSFT